MTVNILVGVFGTFVPFQTLCGAGRSNEGHHCSREAFLEATREAASALVARKLMNEWDVESEVERAATIYDALVK